MAKKPKTLKQFLIPVLRKASQRWPAKIQARKNAKVIVDAGFFLNGNVKTKVMYKCQNPECGKIVDQFGGHIDHIVPVIKVEEGFQDWEKYISSLFCDISNLAHICVECHTIKSQQENTERYKYKTIKKAPKSKK